MTADRSCYSLCCLDTRPARECLDHPSRWERSGDGEGPGVAVSGRHPTAGPSLPAEWGDPDVPLVYVSFGSVAGSLGRFDALYPATLEVLADLPVRVLITTGDGYDPARLDPLPASAWGGSVVAARGGDARGGAADRTWWVRHNHDGYGRRRTTARRAAADMAALPDVTTTVAVLGGLAS